MIPLATDVQPPPTAEQLLAQLKAPLKTIIAEDVDADVDTERVWQLYNARRNTLFFRGFQHLAPAIGSDGIADFTTVGPGPFGGNSACYSYSQNIFRGLGRKFIAVLGQRAPNVAAISNDPNDQESIKSTRPVGDLNAILNAWWGVDEVNLNVAAILWKTGPAFLYTPWNADGNLYGWRQEPKLAPMPMPLGASDDPLAPEPDSADIPQQIGVEKYANGQVECHVYDCRYVTVPFATEDVDLADYLKLEYEENRGKLMAKFPQLRGKNLDSNSSQTSSTETARLAVDAGQSPTGYPIRRVAATRWLYTRIWLQPWMYEFAKDDPTRQLLYDNFPEGLKVTLVQGEMVALEPERLGDVWAAGKPETADTLNADAIGQDVVSTQILKNQTLNIAAETIERGLPLTFADPRVLNFQEYSKRSAQPCDVYPTLPAVGESLSDSFFSQPAAHFSEQQEPWMASVESGTGEVVGVVPQIFGGGDAPTARQAEINKNAAMMQLGTTWTYIRKLWEKAKRNGVMQLAKYGTGIVKGGKSMVDLAELQTTGWHFEADEAIPATWGQMRDLVMFMMEKPSPVLEAFGFNRPENIIKNKSYLGMVGYYTPGEDDAEKTNNTILELLKGKPIQKPMPDGSIDIQPSITVDEFEDNHQLVVQMVQGWAQKQYGQDGARAQNPDGYANVIAYGKASAKLLNPPPPPPTPPEPKMTIAVSSKDLPPQTLEALFSDFKLQVPVPPTPGLPGTPLPPPPVAGAPQGPPIPPPTPPQPTVQ